MLKVDVFVLKARAYDQQAFERASEHHLDPASSARAFLVSSAEDTILNKLEWYRLGSEIADRQWRDVLGVLQVQAVTLDFDYLRRWAAELGVPDLLERAIEQIGGAA